MRPTSLKLFALAFLIAAAGAAEPPTVEELRQCAGPAWRTDVERLDDYAFDRQVTLHDVNKDGEVTDETRRRFRLTPKGDGTFDELLIVEQGRPPTDKEIKRFRDKGNFSANYESAGTLTFNNPLGEDLVLGPVIGQQKHVIVGEDEVNGVACYRTEFEAGPEPGRASTQEQLLVGLRGSACIAIEGCHIVLLDLETVRPIKQGVSKIDSMHLTLEMQPVAGGWVVDEVVAEFVFAALGKRIRRTSTYSYSNFDRYPPASD